MQREKVHCLKVLAIITGFLLFFFGCDSYENTGTAIDTIPRSVTITVDGNISDWSTVPDIATATGQTTTSMKIANDADKIYFLILGSGMGSYYDLFIDSDNNASTGYSDSRWTSDGFDYMIENSTLYKANSNGTSWSWTSQGTASVTKSKSATVTEISVSRSAFTSLSATIKAGYKDLSSSWSRQSNIPVSGSPASYTLGNSGGTSFLITSSASAGGTITSSTNVAQGSSCTFTITPNSGYIISSVTVDGSNIGAVTSYTFTNVQSTHSIASVFTASTANVITMGPYLQNYGSSTTMDILFRTVSAASSAYVEWGTTASYGNNSGSLTVNSASSQYRYQYRITGLTAGQKYYYRVYADGDTETGSFYAVPSTAPGTYSFYALGDTQDNYGTSDDGIWQPSYGKNEVAKAIYNDITANQSTRQTFVLYAGDLNDNYNFSNWYNCFFNKTNSYSEWLTMNTITIAAQGNHDGAHITSAPNYRDIFPITAADGRKGYYSVNYGSTHIVVIEPFGDAWNDEGGHPLEGEAQWAWLSTDLQAAKAASKFIVCVYHTPAWTMSGHTDNAVMQNVHAKLFVPYGVDVCVSGHNHYYARAKKDSIYHLTLGSGGAVGSYTTLNTTSYPNITVCKGDSDKTFFTKFTVSGDTMQVTVYEHTGNGAVSSTAVDSFSISASDN